MKKVVNKVLVIYDGSRVGKNVLKLGLKFSKSFNAECHALRVINQEQQFSTSEMFNSGTSREETYIDRDFQSAKFIGVLEGVEIRPHIFSDTSAGILRDFTQKEQFDLIVINLEKQQGIKETFLKKFLDQLLRTY